MRVISYTYLAFLVFFSIKITNYARDILKIALLLLQREEIHPIWLVVLTVYGCLVLQNYYIDR